MTEIQGFTYDERAMKNIYIIYCFVKLPIKIIC